MKDKAEVLLVANKENGLEVGRFHPFIGPEGPSGEQRYSSTIFFTTALEGREGSASRLGRNLPPGKTLYPFYNLVFLCVCICSV
jgi:hypothetical protein